MVGPNGSGKSAVIKALDLFSQTSAKVSEDDFYNRDISLPIFIRITFKELTEGEKEKFKPYVYKDQDEHLLTVEKQIKWAEQKPETKIYGLYKGYKDFDSLRKAKGREVRDEYMKLIESGQFPEWPSDLPNTREELENLLREWEEKHPERVELFPRDTQFYGFQQVGEAYLKEYTPFIAIPAVKEASEEVAEKKTSFINQIMDIVIRNRLSKSDDYKSFQKTFQSAFKERIDQIIRDQKEALQKDMSKSMQYFAPGTDVKIDFRLPEDFTPLVQPDVRIVEHGFEVSVERVGHGTQRAFIFSLLEQMVSSQRFATEKVEEPGIKQEVQHLIITIEEPEIYQHPSRQRHIAYTLQQLAEKGIGGMYEKVQIIYSTHSPYLVNVEKFESIRIFRREKQNEGPAITMLSHTSATEIAEKLGHLDSDKIRDRLRRLTQPWANEGFFANKVVLVEGVKDRGILLGMAKFLGYDWEKENIAIIPCQGKNNLIFPFTLFRCLDIPVYIIFDSDEDEAQKWPEKRKMITTVNHELMELLGQGKKDFPQEISSCFACFRTNMEQFLQEEVGGKDMFQQIIDVCKDGIDCSNDAILQNPELMAQFFEEAERRGKRCDKIREIIKKIFRLLD